MEENLLDEGEKKVSVVNEMILWWEKRRLIYNALLISLSLYLIVSFWDYPMRKIVGGEIIIIRAFLFVLLANLFYTSGWFFGVLSHWMFGVKGLSTTARWTLFTIGTLISLFFTDVYFVMEFDVLFAD